MTVALHHVENGAGLPLVLLHAFPLSSAMWVNQRAELSEVCRVITPDQRGFGHSPLDPTDPPSLDAAADDLAALLDRLELPTVALGGLSMGGYVAMAFLRKYRERVSALILADTRADTDTAEGRANRERLATRVTSDGTADVLFDEMLPNLLGRSTKHHRPGVVQQVRTLMGEADPAAVAWTLRALADRPDSSAVLAETTVPTLVVVGDEDAISTVSDAEAMSDGIPTVTMARLMAAGHLSAMEDSAAFNAAVRDFMLSLTPAP